jgi:hypothetical protein
MDQRAWQGTWNRLWHRTVRQEADLATLAAVIARSPIVVRAPENRLPEGFDAVDIAILDWIAAQARAGRRRYVQM